MPRIINKTYTQNGGFKKKKNSCSKSQETDCVCLYLINVESSLQLPTDQTCAQPRQSPRSK